MSKNIIVERSVIETTYITYEAEYEVSDAEYAILNDPDNNPNDYDAVTARLAYDEFFNYAVERERESLGIEDDDLAFYNTDTKQQLG